jgi:ribosomal protein S18 acetylase RimI-like enzyme
MTEPVRVADVADAPRIAELLHDFNDEYEDYTPPVAVLERRVRALIEADEMIVVLGGEPPFGVGVLRLRPTLFTENPDALDAYLQELYVVPDRRGEGLGGAMLELVMEVARERGATWIELGTSEDDDRARALYERMGFTNREGEGGPVMYVYEREL